MVSRASREYVVRKALVPRDVIGTTCLWICFLKEGKKFAIKTEQVVNRQSTFQHQSLMGVWKHHIGAH